MFTSINTDDFNHDDSILSSKPFSSDPKQHQVHHQHNHHQFSLFNLPSPYHFQCFSDDFDYPERAVLDLDLDLDVILFHHKQLQQQQKQQQQEQATVDFVCGKDQIETRAAVSAVPGMRSSKKDRHSKITTARGLRDRRMRLSLEVAREFFELQDMLGFDKASKTIEWLISQSKSAIREIIRKVKGSGGGSGIAASYDSDCKIGHDHNSDDDVGDRTVESSAGQKQSNMVRKARQSRRSNSHRQSSSASREFRMKARERARERTLEKKWKRSLENSRSNPRKPCSGPLETGEESCCVQTGTTGSNLEILTEEIAKGQISVDVSSDLIYSKQSPEMASSSNLNLQEIGIPPFNQLKNCEQFLKQWDAFYNCGYNRS